jgi:uncharacterized protein
LVDLAPPDDLPVTAVAHAQTFAAAHASVTALLQLHQHHHAGLGSELRPQLEQLEQLQVKLKQHLVQIAVFGRVSRGKSAVLNALYGEKVFQTGPLNGVTQWPRSIRLPLQAWAAQPPENLEPIQSEPIQIELVDTPGLDEVAGAIRGQMAQTVAQEADLILCITAGLLTPTELQALSELAALHKPIILVLNKQDLYPELQPEQIHAQFTDPNLARLITPAEMVMTSAAPAPVQVRQQWPDGRSLTAWENVPPNVQALQQKLVQILQAEASLISATQALSKAQQVEQMIVEHIFQHHQPQAEQLIWRYSAGKALGILICRWLGLDLLLGLLADLLLVRGLSKAYGFPMTNLIAQQLWPTLLRSVGILLCSNLADGWITSGLTGLEAMQVNPLTKIIPALIPMIAAGYGSYQVASRAQAGLRQGGISGPQGTQTTLQAIRQHFRPSMLAARLNSTIV